MAITLKNIQVDVNSASKHSLSATDPITGLEGEGWKE
jgi:hypothetical protein